MHWMWRWAKNHKGLKFRVTSKHLQEAQLTIPHTNGQVAISLLVTHLKYSDCCCYCINACPRILRCRNSQDKVQIATSVTTIYSNLRRNPKTKTTFMKTVTILPNSSRWQISWKVKKFLFLLLRLILAKRRQWGQKNLIKKRGVHKKTRPEKESPQLPSMLCAWLFYKLWSSVERDTLLRHAPQWNILLFHGDHLGLQVYLPSGHLDLACWHSKRRCGYRLSVRMESWCLDLWHWWRRLDYCKSVAKLGHREFGRLLFLDFQTWW